jgi:hypothetical protein
MPCQQRDTRINSVMRYHELRESVDIRSPDFVRWFAGSKVVDADGTPLIVHHGSHHWDAISEFKPMTHFGTAQAANKRLKDQQHGVYSTMNAAMYPVYLRIRNPLRIMDKQGVQHHVSTIARYLAFGTFASHVSNPNERNKRYGKISLADYDRIHPRYDKQTLIDIVTEKGHDGFVYINRVEDRGSYSWVILDPAQVWPVFKS